MSITPLYINRRLSDDERRTLIFDGGLFLYSSPPASSKMVEWAREMIHNAFSSVSDVRHAHSALTVKQFVDCAGPLKSSYTNSLRTKEICQELISGMGCDPELTYFDLPRLRVAPPGDYLTTGVSYSYKPHRDTWYAHPRQLVNYWVPIYDAAPSHVMSMYVDYFGQPVNNASNDWDYDEWVKKARYSAAQNIGAEKRQHPLPTQALGETTDLRIVQNAGDLMVFSTCQLHASVPNELDTIRFSYDLRTLHIEDVRQDRGPVNVDGKATGSTLKDFLRVSDLKPLDPAIVGRPSSSAVPQTA